ncbi:unnamed protein product, partial [Didymodactylos carnosus]
FTFIMPRPTKRHSHLHSLNQKRCSDENLGSVIDSESSEEELAMEVDQNEDKKPLNFKDKVMLNDISDLFELCQSKCLTKYITCLLYMAMRHLGLKWNDCHNFMKEIGALTSQTAHKWTSIFIHGDFDEFCHENRGGKRKSEFYDSFPELEEQAKLFTLERCSRKSADFTANDLAKFVDDQFYLITQTVKDDGAPLVRSPASCRIDLRRWGARFEQNGNRPNFEGHERADVIEHRAKFIDFFLGRKDNFYTISDGDQPMWKMPATILFCEYILRARSLIPSPFAFFSN